MLLTQDDWADGYLKQAKAEWEVWNKVNTASNSEYPWQIGDQLFVPVDYAFPEMTKRLKGPDGVLMMKVIDAIFAQAEA